MTVSLYPRLDMRFDKLSSALLSAGLFLSNGAMEATELEIGSALYYDSKYVSEGRDNLGEGGLPSAELTLEYDAVSFGVWYARGDQVDYDELDFCATYGFSFKDWDAYLCYTRLEYLEDSCTDDEIGLGLSRDVAGFTLAVDYVYSRQMAGAFLTFSVSREFAVDGTNCFYGFNLQEGFDLGYASEAYDGPNNFQAGLYLGYMLNEQVSLIVGMSNSWAHEDVRRDGLGDVFWASLALFASY